MVNVRTLQEAVAEILKNSEKSLGVFEIIGMLHDKGYITAGYVSVKAALNSIQGTDVEGTEVNLPAVTAQ